uniref:16 kDa thioredoxion n=1 Tax=Carcinoscorpius rotundicauda TaxID=6848 RepID=A3E0V9_CARRO|nr:16 kDa thioredoxion [Carcinoscorpius rotundicauda]2LUS_A Chain A, Thioredoxion [Carcinoscorpius rotundicauda]
MEFIQGIKLVKKNRCEVNANEALKDKDIIGFYFSAHWCPPCRGFTPILADMYSELVDDSAPFEIIFVSSDRSEDDMFQYMMESHGDWLAIPYRSGPASNVTAKYGITGIPALVIVKKDGTLISMNGRGEVQSLGPRAFQNWAR